MSESLSCCVGAVMHPLAHLVRDGDLEGQLSEICEHAFGYSLSIDRINAETRLRVGRVEKSLVPRYDRPTLEYSDALLALPTLDDQGDGMKSFIGLVLTVIAGSSQILLVDEPEAFLHPPRLDALVVSFETLPLNEIDKSSSPLMIAIFCLGFSRARAAI
jgi:AAA domain, putative AbiEii toxin, Type IV TA system